MEMLSCTTSALSKHCDLAAPALTSAAVCRIDALLNSCSKARDAIRRYGPPLDLQAIMLDMKHSLLYNLRATTGHARCGTCPEIGLRRGCDGLPFLPAAHSVDIHPPRLQVPDGEADLRLASGQIIP